MRRTSSLAVPLSFLAAATFAAIGASPVARAAGDNAGELGPGGTAKGDVSSAAGETDAIGIDLVAGEPLDIRFRATFSANVVLTDPSGSTVTTTFVPGAKTLNQKGFVAPATGRFEFRVSSFDGGQGIYVLKVTPKWAKKIEISAPDAAAAAVPMPAGSRLAASFQGPGVTLARITRPDLSVVVPALEGTSRGLVVPAFDCEAAGDYTIFVSTLLGPVEGTAVRILPRVKPTNLKLTNGLSQISFTGDGIDDIFRQKCASCHSWAGAYGGVRAYSARAFGTIREGSMPPVARLPQEQVSLIEAWIKTGRAR